MSVCRNPLADRLLEYTRGLLDEDDRRAVDEHLEQCSMCDQRLDTLRWIADTARQTGARLFAPHVESPILQRFVDEPEGLDQRARQRVAEHLDLCVECGQTADALRTVSASLDADAAAERHAVPRGRSWAPGGWLSRWSHGWRLRTLLPAAAACVLLLYPAIVGMQTLLGDRAQPRAPARSLGRPLVLDAGTLRGLAADVPRVAAGTRHTLELRAPFRTDNAVHYDARLEGARGRTLWTADALQSVDAFGSRRIELDTTRLAAGRYRIIVSERHSTTGGDRPEFVFELEITATP